MNIKQNLIVFLTAIIVFPALGRAQTQTPLDQPLADFDKLISNLKASVLVGEPVQAGDTTIIPFANGSIRLGWGRGHDGLRRRDGRGRPFPWES